MGSIDIDSLHQQMVTFPWKLILFHHLKSHFYFNIISREENSKRGDFPSFSLFIDRKFVFFFTKFRPIVYFTSHTRLAQFSIVNFNEPSQLA